MVLCYLKCDSVNQLTPSARLVLSLIISDKLQCKPQRNTADLQKILGFSYSCINIALKDLKKAGFIKLSYLTTWGRPVTYALNLEHPDLQSLKNKKIEDLLNE